jgi:anti-sigma-K factor RskA
MDIKEYISSGILELYVLGSLSSEEMKEVERLSMLYPEIKEEIDLIEITLENVALSGAKKIPIDLKNQILKEINGNISIENTAIENTKPKSNSLVLEKTNFKYWAIAASVLLAIGSFLFFQKQNQVNTQEKYIALLKDSLINAEKTLAITNNYEFQKIILPSTDTTKLQSVAQVFWNKNAKEVYIQLVDQQPLPKGKQYQLWALADGKPIDAGVLELNQTLQKVKSIEQAQAFAITIENEGGSPSPTLTALVAMGKI